MNFSQISKDNENLKSPLERWDKMGRNRIVRNIEGCIYSTNTPGILIGLLICGRTVLCPGDT